MLHHHKVIILGSGPAGCTAAIYAARANLSPVIITGLQPGGQLTTTSEVDNWPGDVDGVVGSVLMERMLKHAERFQTSVISDIIVKAQLHKKPFLLVGEENQYSCDALIIATGASAKYLGLASEEKYRGMGVSACAVCDGFFYRNKSVAVVGGGNTALEEALYLSDIAKHVTVVHRREQFRAESFLVKQLNSKENITVEWNCVVDEILGNDSVVTGIRVKDVTNGEAKEIGLNGVFIAIGHHPNTEIFQDQLTMKQNFICIGGGVSGNVTATNIPGVFAAGDCADPVYRQAITSAAFGCMAALDAGRYLEDLKML